MTKNDALPVSVTRMPNEGRAVSQITSRLPAGAGFRFRRVRSVMSCFMEHVAASEKVARGNGGQRTQRVNACWRLFHSVIGCAAKCLMVQGLWSGRCEPLLSAVFAPTLVYREGRRFEPVTAHQAASGCPFS